VVSKEKTSKFGLIWFSGFKGEELNVKNKRTTDNGRGSPSDDKYISGLQIGKLKIY